MRGQYENVKELIDAIETHVKNGGVATLALDYRWWAERICSPYEARIVEDAKLFEVSFSYNEILDQLKERGLTWNNPIGQSGIGYVKPAA